MPGTSPGRAALLAALLPALSGCYLDSTVVGTPRTPVERALAFCGEKTEAAETACLRAALADGHLGVAALAATIPGCRLGADCTLRYRTRDRAGLLGATATDTVADWQVTFDLKGPAAAKPGARAADIPFKLQQI